MNSNFDPRVRPSLSLRSHLGHGHLWNIVTGDDLQTQFIINNNALPCLLALLSSPKKGICKEACWTISNITVGNKDQIQAVIDNNIIPPLIQLLTNAEFDIRKEAQMPQKGEESVFQMSLFYYFTDVI